MDLKGKNKVDSEPTRPSSTSFFANSQANKAFVSTKKT